MKSYSVMIPMNTIEQEVPMVQSARTFKSADESYSVSIEVKAID